MIDILLFHSICCLLHYILLQHAQMPRKFQKCIKSRWTTHRPLFDTDKHLALIMALLCSDRCMTEIWLWHVTLTASFDLDHKARYDWWQNTVLGIWLWPLTYDLDLQSQNSQSICRPPCQKSRSHVKWFSCESVHRQMDGQTDWRMDGRMLPSTLSACRELPSDGNDWLWINCFLSIWSLQIKNCLILGQN